MLFRRRDGALPTSAAGLEKLSQRASIELLHADDELAAAEHEVGYAIAQFGDSRTREFSATLASARSNVAEAFKLKHQLDDAHPESPTKRRELNNQIIALAESARTSLRTQSTAFAQLRRTEADSPARLAALREGIAETRRRGDKARATLTALGKRYKPSAFDEVKGNIARANELLDQADRKADESEQRMSSGATVPVSDVVNDAASLVHDARRLLDTIDDAAAALDEADDALSALVADARASIVEARAMRDAAPDADTGAELIGVISRVEAALPNQTRRGPVDPVEDIERVGEAVSGLDVALAGARNQQQRLEYATTALAGALVGVRSQLALTKNFMAQHRVGVAARSRLAEAERQLLLAESEADPVAALDAARRAGTAARDAEDLARYDSR